ncbi:pyridoxamine 5'-phosphate oxidase family protein [Sporichthya sp.]|uniref:pyridoxamine 5'-phosphate oxidase family protein n=1 Tax=Sporichthya sp. TaxID=65475 RepID=UPI001800F5ED|nr:pyridoxamine 5'-phosphate oxidase family protein [Sporichthya sp.]MBA3742559.1 pyridoxamine 5'-phosphate oxidase family protein [Sporichthya sp.]
MRKPHRRLDVLDRAECLALLGSVRLGRVAYNAHGAPRVEVVNFLLDGDGAVIRMGIGSRSAAVGRGGHFALEADRLDETGDIGWNVTAIGPVRWVSDPAEFRRLDRLLISSAPGDRSHLARISFAQVFGRRLRAVAYDG